MPDFNKWLDDEDAIDAQSRAVDAYKRIKHQPSTIVVVRDGTDLSAQVVRIEFSGESSKTESEAGRMTRQRCVVFGVVNHPSIVADTDIKRGDRFTLDGVQYNVLSAVKLPGEVQAFSEAIR